MRKTDDFAPQATARKILRSSATGALATLSADDGTPFASLVTVATDFAGCPILLLSDLALHTRNLQADARVSLLLEERNPADPMQGARLSVNGTIAVTHEPGCRRRFLARHPDASGYADFPDFSFYRLMPENAHLVAGFGRINSIDGVELLEQTANTDALAEAEEGILAHMNADHRDALSAYATALLGLPAGDWMMTGCDPHGIDLALIGPLSGASAQEVRTARLTFDHPVTDAAAMRAALVALARKARGE
ncbi:DUF2470 domain-containing protein [Breoghania sp.]|uniref:HugZ family pyridoxamine 5'-phosphate oxidase n=1 Tax=Breoghania sp. TaxID=2065378 RepID=UPI002AA81AC1|nr:DUF2470 domain-containing protein [Breoghania sp.]